MVVYRAGAVNYFVITHDGAATAGNPENITVEVRDLQDNTIEDFSGNVLLYTNTSETADRITWGIGTGTGIINFESKDTLSYRFAETDFGSVSFVFTDYSAEQIFITAETAGVSSQSPLLSVDNSAQDEILIVSGDDQRAVVGTRVGLPLVVRVEDQYSNPVDNSEVTFAVTGGGGSIDTDTLAAGIQTTAYTDIDGLAECQSWALGTISGNESDQATASITSGTTSSVIFTATSDHDVADVIFLTPASADVTVNSSTRVEATVRDRFGNLVTNTNLSVFIKDSPVDGYLSGDYSNPNPTDSLGPALRTGVTDSTGSISVVYNAPSAAGLTDIIDANHQLVPGSEVADVAFTTVASGATKLSVTGVTPQPVEAGETFSFLVRAVDSNDNLDPDNGSHISITSDSAAAMTFSLSDFGAQINEADLVNGELILYARAEKAGIWNISIDAAGPVLSSVDFDSEVVPNNTVAYYTFESPASAVAGEDFTLEVRAKDEYANFISSASRYLMLRAVQAGDTTQSAAGVLSVTEGNLAGGLFYSSNISYEVAESIRIEVTDTSSSVTSCSQPVSIDNASAYRLIESGGDTTSVAAGDSVMLRAAVEDRFGNRVDGEVVSFAVLEGGGGLAASQRITRSDGSTSVSYATGTTAGLNRVRAAILDGNPSALETVLFDIETVASSEIDYVDLSLEGTTFEAGETIFCQAYAYDENGNLVSSDSTTRLLPVAESEGMYFTPDTLTLAGGQVSFTAADTSAGTNRIMIESLTGQVLYPYGQYLTITSAPAYLVLKVSGDTTGVISGDAVDLTVRVSDRFGNPVGGEVTRFDIISSLGGSPSLIDDTGNSGDGIDITDTDGVASVTLVSDLNAGNNLVEAVILDGDPPERERVEFSVSTTAGNISRYSVTAAEYTRTAGESFSVDIVAYDLNNNIAYGDDTTMVIVDSDGAALFSPDTVQLSNGSAAVSAYDETAEKLVISAQTLGGGALSFSDTLSILPDIPDGVIGIYTTVPDTITADTRSTSAITTDPVRDRFGNVAEEGTEITVTVTDGWITSDDYNASLSGIQRITGASGRVSVFVRASNTPGDVSVDFTSVEGAAQGSAALVYAPPAACVFGDYIFPNVIVPDSSVTFRCAVENISPTGLYIDPSSSISFSDGVQTFSAALEEARFIDGMSSDTLVFREEALPSDFLAGTYTPSIEIKGSDIYSSQYGAVFLATANSVAVTAISISDITLYRTILSRGDTAQVDVTVKNQGGIRAFLQDIQLNFSLGDYGFVGDWAPLLVDTIQPGLSRTYSRLVRVLPNSPVGIDTVDAMVHAAMDGNEIYDYSADENKATWLIQSATRLSYSGGSLSPVTVSAGQAHSFGLSIVNTGEAALIIDRSQSYMTFSDGSSTFTSYPEADYGLSGQAETDIDFAESTISSSFSPGTYPVTLRIRGSENGALFDTTLVLSDSVRVVTPAALSYIPGTLSPQSVSKNSSVALSVGIFNTGEASIVCESSNTFITFTDGSVSYTSQLAAGLSDTIQHGPNALYFRSETVPGSMATGNYTPDLHVEGLENGKPFMADITLGSSISVEEPSRLAINSIDISPRDRITMDQAADWEASIKLQNNGEAPVRLDSIRCRLFSGVDEVTGQYYLTYLDFDPGVDELAGGQIDSFRVLMEDNPFNPMTAGMVVVESTVGGTDVNSQETLIATTEYGGKGGFLVQTPAQPVVTDIVTSTEEVTVLQDRDWTVDVTISNEGESDVLFHFSSESTYPIFSTGEDFKVIHPENFVSGDSILRGNSSEVLHFVIDTTGSVSGDCVVNVSAEGTEINSSRLISGVSADGPATATVEVQEQGILEITGLASSQDPVTVGQPGQWYIDMEVSNTGGSDILLEVSDHDSTKVDIAGSSGFVFEYPNALREGGLTLEPSQSGTLRFDVVTTGSVPAGKRVLTGSLLGEEINSGNRLYTELAAPASGDSVKFELPPDPEYVLSSLKPLSASGGTNISVNLTVSSSSPDHSTLELDPSGTMVTFGDADGDTFRAHLSPISNNILTAGGNVDLVFESSLIDTSISTGPYQVEARLAGVENGNDYTKVIDTQSDSLEVEAAPRLSITSILSPASVTASLQPQWRVRMVIHNTGEASVDVNTATDKTYITLSVPGYGDVTGEYGIDNPVYLEGSGTTILAGNQVDTLVFTVNNTGTTTGTAVINGQVTAGDVNSGDILIDETFTGGSGYVSVQQPALLAITETSVSRPAVTSGQTTPWSAELLVENLGEAAVTLDMDSTGIYADYPLTVPAPPAGFSEGGLTLAGGESKHLIFSVTPTPQVPSGIELDIYAEVAAVENNRSEYVYFDSGEEQAGYGTVQIQTPAVLRTLSLENAAPRSPYVNMGGRFPVVFQVENAGEAQADSIEIGLLGDGASIVEEPVKFFGPLPGFSQSSDTFFVTASDAAGTENFRAELLSAIDSNSGERSAVDYSGAADSLASAQIQVPGALEIVELVTSQSYVNAGQTADWSITARVSNAGEAPVSIDEPRGDDLSFSGGGDYYSDYLVIPPSGFASGAGDLTLEGAEADSLIYLISSTGLDTGTVTASMSLGWIDENEPDSDRLPVERETDFVVREPSGLRITAVQSSAPNSGIAPNTSYVNTTQGFQITVTVQNTGGDDIDSISVELSTNGGSQIVLADSCPRLDSGTQGDFIFDITSPSLPGVEVLTAAIVKAVSVNTGDEVSPIQAVESVENLYIQTPADLFCSANISHPPGSVDDTVSTDQDFVVKAVVSNGGEAQVDESGQIRIILKDGMTLVDPSGEPSIRSFAVDQEVSWKLHSSLSPSAGADTIEVEIYNAPADLNADAPAGTSEPVSYILVVTEQSASISGCDLQIILPSGAADGIVSTEQGFSVRAGFIPSSNSEEAWVELDPPTGYSIEGDARREAGNGEGVEKSVAWNLTAPADEHQQFEKIYLSSGGTDDNSGDVFDGCQSELEVRSEKAALLNLSAAITAPEQALEGILSTDLPFIITASVQNEGAAVDTSGARLEISLPDGYRLDSQEETFRKRFYPGTEVTWNLRAPSAVSPPGNILVRFTEPYALDSNTDQPAVLGRGEVSIPVKTEAGSVSMDNISKTENIPPLVAPQGSRNVPMLKVTFNNTSVYNIGLDTLLVSVEDENLEKLEDPSSALDSVRFVMRDGGAFSAAVGQVNPVPVIVDKGFTVDSLASDTAMVNVDIAGGVSEGKINVEIARSRDVVFSTVDGNAPVGVVWIEGGDIAGNFVTTSFNVMSGNFNDFVHNYPNPFSRKTTISYFLTEDAPVQINIYDYTGLLVWTKSIPAGEEGAAGGPGRTECSVEWDGRNGRGELVRNGVYICKVKVGSQTAVFKIAVAK